MAQIVISEFMDIEAVNGLAEDFDVLYDPELVDRPDSLHAALSDSIAIIVRNRTQVRGALLDSAPALKVVGRLGVGLDNIDMPACERRGIAVRPASGANDQAVAEYTIAMAMVLLRGSCVVTGKIADGSWPRQESVGRETSGKTIGFVGYGGIARQTARLARALGMRVLAYDPFVDKDHPELGDCTLVGLTDLLETADVVSLHVPLSDSTRDLIDERAIGLMRNDAVLINTARGGVVDENALCDALKAGRLGGAALDVFSDEPVTAAGGARFRDVPNLVLTPHIGGVTQESNIRVSEVTSKNVRAVLEAVQCPQR